MKVLLLNATYEPLRVLPIKRAIVLVMEGRAEVVAEGRGRFRSASTSVPVPSVIRLKSFVQIPYRARLPMNRRAVLHRDEHVCQYGCGRVGTTIDHVLPRSRKGQHAWENVVACCAKCNQKKADRTPEEMGWTLLRKPFAPTSMQWLLIGMGIEAEEEWKPYFEGVLV